MKQSRRKFLASVVSGSAIAIAGCNKASTLSIGSENELQTQDKDYNYDGHTTGVVEQKINGTNTVFKNLDYKKEDEKYFIQVEFKKTAAKTADTFRIFIGDVPLNDTTPIPDQPAILSFAPGLFEAELLAVAYNDEDVVVALEGILVSTVDSLNTET